MTASIVRVAGPEDAVEVWRLFLQSHNENALFSLSPKKVEWFMSRALAPQNIPPNDTGPRGCIVASEHIAATCVSMNDPQRPCVRFVELRLKQMPWQGFTPVDWAVIGLHAVPSAPAVVLGAVFWQRQEDQSAGHGRRRLPHVWRRRRNLRPDHGERGVRTCEARASRTIWNRLR